MFAEDSGNPFPSVGRVREKDEKRKSGIRSSNSLPVFATPESFALIIEQSCKLLFLFNVNCFI